MNIQGRLTNAFKGENYNGSLLVRASPYADICLSDRDGERQTLRLVFLSQHGLLFEQATPGSVSPAGARTQHLALLSLGEEDRQDSQLLRAALSKEDSVQPPDTSTLSQHAAVSLGYTASSGLNGPK